MIELSFVPRKVFCETALVEKFCVSGYLPSHGTEAKSTGCWKGSEMTKELILMHGPLFAMLILLYLAGIWLIQFAISIRCYINLYHP